MTRLHILLILPYEAPRRMPHPQPFFYFVIVFFYFIIIIIFRGIYGRARDGSPHRSLDLCGAARRIDLIGVDRFGWVRSVSMARLGVDRLGLGLISLGLTSLIWHTGSMRGGSSHSFDQS